MIFKTLTALFEGLLVFLLLLNFHNGNAILNLFYYVNPRKGITMKSFTTNYKSNLQKACESQAIIYRLLASLIFIGILKIQNANALELDPLSLDYIQTTTLMQVFFPTFVVFALLSIISIVFPLKHIDCMLYVYNLTIYALLLARQSTSLHFLLGLFAVLAVSYYLAYQRIKVLLPKLPRVLCLLLIAGVFLYSFRFLSTVSIVKYKSFLLNTFDFGIFSQMFYSMKEHLTLVTTCERNIPLSHFAVHLSPIFYMFLPVFYLIPKQTTLLFLQAAGALLGVIPLYGICKNHSLSRNATTGVCIVYLLCPALMGAALYEFHENAFLPVFLLALIYFYESDSTPGLIISTLLTLMVKEDAAIYVACFALYALVTKKSRKKAFLLLCSACLYFAGCTVLLRFIGEGIKSNRLQNFIGDSPLGLLQIPSTILISPAYLISQICTQEKLLFLIMVFLPLACIPFMTKAGSRFVLLLPLLLNLMSNYQYQNSIFYQYTFGFTTLLLYMLVLNLEDMSHEQRRFMLTLALLGTLLVFNQQIYCKLDIQEYYDKHEPQLTHMMELVEQIPEDASVLTTSGLLPSLSLRDEVYMIDITGGSYSKHPEVPECQYVVLDLRYDQYRDLISTYLEQGYTVVNQIENYIMVLTK